MKMKTNPYKKGVAFFNVSLPIYEPYKKLDSPIVQCAAKRIRIVGGDDLLNLEFLQENGCDEQSFSFSLPFSQKNVEEKLAELFGEFSLL